MLALSRSIDSSLEIPCPKGKTYHPFQKGGVEYAIKNPYPWTLMADVPGLGKTIQAIGFLNLRGPTGKTLIVVPASLMHNWKKELKAWLTYKQNIFIVEEGTTYPPPIADIFIISYSLTINKKLFLYFWKYIKKFATIIYDEIHYLKTEGAQRTQANLGKKGLYLLTKSGLALTGTPIPNRLIELYPIISKLAPQTITMESGKLLSYDQFGQRYCDGYIDSTGRHYDGSSNVKELSDRLRKSFMVRRKKEAVLKDLPPKNLSIVYLNKDNESKKIIERSAEFNNASLSLDRAEINYKGLSVMRRELGSHIAPKAIQYILNQYHSGRKKIIVWAYHRDVLAILKEAFKSYGWVGIDGSTPKNQRQKQVEAFQNTETPFFIGSIKAASVGHTLTAADYMAFIEYDWTPGINDQAVDRAHRIGQTMPVQADFLTLEGSVGENILRTYFKKTKHIDAVLN